MNIQEFKGTEGAMESRARELNAKGFREVFVTDDKKLLPMQYVRIKQTGSEASFEGPVSIVLRCRLRDS